MHSYPLHRNIDVECECCRLIQPFNGSSTLSVVGP